MLWLLAIGSLYRYFNPSTKSENAAYVLALVLPCRWWSLRTARCLSIPPLGQEALPRSTARPRRHPSFHAGPTTTQKYHEPRAGSPAASTRASRPLTRNYRWRISIFRCRPLCCTTSCLTHCGSQEEFRMLRECAVHGPRFLHTRPLSRH